jgi:hypothetical protein
MPSSPGGSPTAEEGSAAYAATRSVFETCRRGIEPWRYLTDLLARARKGLQHLAIPLEA